MRYAKRKPATPFDCDWHERITVADLQAVDTEVGAVLTEVIHEIRYLRAERRHLRSAVELAVVYLEGLNLHPYTGRRGRIHAALTAVLRHVRT